jgi:hypothetical protein
MKIIEELQRTIAAFDSEGWNKEGSIYIKTEFRTRTLFAPILDEALELFLGDPQNITGEIIK